MLTDNSIGHVLLRAFTLRCEQWSDGLSSKVTADLSRACRGQLVKDSRMLLVESARIQLDGTSVPLEPSLSSESGLGQREQAQSNNSQTRFVEHLDAVKSGLKSKEEILAPEMEENRGVGGDRKNVGLTDTWSRKKRQGTAAQRTNTNPRRKGNRSVRASRARLHSFLYLARHTSRRRPVSIVPERKPRPREYCSKLALCCIVM